MTTPNPEVFQGTIDENLTLANVFEQIAVTQKHGWLFLSLDQETTVGMYFQGDLVGLVTPPLEKLKHIVEKLYYASKLNDDEYQSIINSESPEEAIEGFDVEEEYSFILQNICYEEVCSLFSYQDIPFQFLDQNHPDADPNLVPIGQMFESEGIISEVANRQEEWDEIQQFYPPAEEILIVNDSSELKKHPPDDPIGNILRLCDQRTLRDIMEYSYFGEFDTARVLSSLMRDSMIRVLSDDELQSVAAEAFAKRDWQTATSYFYTLHRRYPLENNHCQSLVNCYQNMEQPEKLMELYQVFSQSFLSSNAPEHQVFGAFYLKSFADMSPESQEGVNARYQIFSMVVQQQVDPQSLQYNLIGEGKKLFQSLRDRKDDPNARWVVETLLSYHPHDTSLQSQYINVCLDLGDRQAAVNQYMNMASFYEREQNWEEAEATYQKIAKLMPSKDVQQKLEEIAGRTNKGKQEKARKFTLVFVVLLIAAAGAGWMFRDKILGTIAYKKEYLFWSEVSSNVAQDLLNSGQIPPGLEEAFSKNGIPLEEVSVAKSKKDSEWVVNDNEQQFAVAVAKGMFVVYKRTAVAPSEAESHTTKPIEEVVQERNSAIEQDVKEHISKAQKATEDGNPSEAASFLKKAMSRIKMVSADHRPNVKVIEDELSGLSHSTNQLLEYFDSKMKEAQEKSKKEDTLEFSNRLFASIWQNDRYRTMKARNEIRLSIRIQAIPPGADFFVDGAKLGTLDSNEKTFELSPDFKNAEVVLPGYKKLSYQNGFINRAIPAKEMLPSTIKANLPKEILGILEVGKGGAVGEPVLYHNGVVYGVSSSNYIVAYQIQDGEKPKRLWKKAFGRRTTFNCSPAIHKGILYIGSSNQNALLMAINAQNGRLLAKYPIPSTPIINFAPQICIKEKAVFFTISNFGYIYALPLLESAQKSWKLKWRNRLERAQISHPITITKDENYMFVPFSNGYLYVARTSQGGRPVVRRKTSIDTKPLVIDSSVYLGSSRSLVSLKWNAKRGKLDPNWSKKLDGTINSSIFQVDNNLVFTTSSQKLSAYNVSGNRAWEYPLRDTIITMPPAIGKDNIYVTDRKGIIYAISKAEKKEMWRYKINRDRIRVYSPPMVSGGIISQVIGSKKDNVVRSEIFVFMDN